MEDVQRDDVGKLAALEHTIQETRERLASLEAEKSSLERWLSQNPIVFASNALREKALPGIYGPLGALLQKPRNRMENFWNVLSEIAPSILWRIR